MKRVKRAHRLGLLALGLALVSLPAVPAGAKCADVYSTMAMGPFPADAPATTPLFYSPEGLNGSFNVRWTGLACGQPLKVNAEYADAPGSAAEGSDYQLPEGRTPDVCEAGCPEGTDATITFPMVNDGDASEGVAESFTIALSNPVGGTLEQPSTAAFVIVDDDGAASRVAFDDLSYSQSETYDTLAVPVWRAGPAVGSLQLSYTVGPGPGNGAVVNEDYTVRSPNPLVFGPNDRVEMITLAVVNDKQSEPEETVQVDLQGGAAPSTKVVAIRDNEENVPPTSRLHHPRHRWKYKKSDYRIREVHIFSHDNTGGAGVVGSQLALRRNMGNGSCAWLTKKGWEKKDCQNREWLPSRYDDVGRLWRVRLKQLKSSVGTKIKNYTVFSRAIDGAGNIEKEFKEKRNANTFDVGRTRERR